MPPKGSSGQPLDPSGLGPVAQDVVELDHKRRRITLPVSVVSAASWLAGEGVEALMVYGELGRIDLYSWEATGEAVLTKRRELIEEAREGDTGAVDELLSLQDRYHRAHITKDRQYRRLTIGIDGVLHLGLDGMDKPPVYVAAAIDRVMIMSKKYREQRLQEVLTALIGLP